MYAALWRVLPGPWWVRVLILLIILAVLLTACLVWVFPAIDDLVAPEDVTVSQ